MLLNCGVGEDSWESLVLQGDPTSPSERRSVLSVHWKDWCWSWNSNTMATWCKELTHLKRPWCWERLKAGGEGDDRGWDGWMVSLAQWTWVWVSSRRWWWTARPSVGSQRVGHDYRLNWKDPDAGKDWEQEEKGMTEDEMVGWHHQLNEHGFEWTLGVGDGQGDLACCGSWGHKELDLTE